MTEVSGSDRGRTILVVEDYPDTREMMKLTLQEKGYRVIVAHNGLEAVELAEREIPDAIIMDMSLPMMDGYQAAKHIRESLRLKHVPIIACTAHNRWEWRAKAIAAGCTDFLTKPLDFRLLHETLSHYLSWH